jgi:hypothetical protein
MKKYTILFITGLLLFLGLLTGCDTGNRADLENILSQGSLPILKSCKLIQVSSYDTSGGNNDRIIIGKGKTASILDVPGPGVIVRIWMTVDSRDPYFLRRILIRMYWDGEDNPSVEVPLGDFFGCGFAYKHYSTPFLGMTSGGYVCFFPMPFENNARIEIVNETGQEIPAFYYQVEYQKLEKPISKEVAYFHAFWHRNIRTNYDTNYIILNIKGRGHLIGVNLNVQSYEGNLDFLEGDEEIFVDGEKRPSIQGTGTEDYFSGGWYFNKGEYAAPYSGLILKDDSLGRIAAYRFHVPDPISFKKSIKFTIEHGHGNLDIADYSSTAYWYQTEPHQKFPPIPVAGQRIPLRMVTPNRILEAENLKFNMGSIPSKIEIMTDYGPEWSGSKQLVIESQNKDAFSLILPNLKENEYSVNIFYTKGPDYGNFKILMNDQIAGEINGYHPILFPGGTITLKNIKNPGQILNLRFVVDGKDADSKGFKVGLDGISLEPKRKFIPDWYIVGPFPNPRKTEAERRGLDSIYTPERNVDLNTIYTGKNGQQIKWQHILTPENGYIDLTNKLKSYELSVCYALTYIYAVKPELVSLFIGSDDGAKIFFNNKQLYRYLGVRVAEPDQAEIYLDVKPGWNKLLLKIENNMGGYGFYARLVDRDSTLIISADQQLPVVTSKNSKKKK